MKQELNICHLYPDILNLYGDRGNIICMKKRLEWRGLGCSVTELRIGDSLDFTDYDLFFIGGGQDFEQEVLLRDLSGRKSRAIKDAVAEGKTFLAICGGFQILGNYYETWDGVRCDFTGAIDVHSVGAKERMTGNIMFSCEELGGKNVVGFENHSGRTFLGPGVRPLGKVLRGHGNNGEDGGEGARFKNVFASYAHGPLLPKNPELCDLILLTALRDKYGGSCELAPLDDSLENAAHDYMEKRLGGERS